MCVCGAKGNDEKKIGGKETNKKNVTEQPA